uniref:Uncharacterized protein n=1 Tax=viral metagenome TaxID=1070528 RepID=A0A6C0KL05_9ZZZZ
MEFYIYRIYHSNLWVPRYIVSWFCGWFQYECEEFDYMI